MITLPDKIKNDLSSNAYQLQYLLEIKIGNDDPIYIGTSPTSLLGDEGSSIYYQDVNLKVSNLKEKIDLKTKKIQYSNLEFTISNLETHEGQLVDDLESIYGANLSLYAITQSCDSEEDRITLAKLKVTRMEHDNTSIKIIANDTWLEGFYLDLPKTILEKDVDTYEGYNLKPVPILYGHLEDAPTAVYLDETQIPKLLVDDSYFDETKEIGGVKQYNILKQDNFSVTGEDNWKDEKYSPDCLKLRLGSDTMVDVVCRPYINSRSEISSNYNYPQYETQHDYIELFHQYGGASTLLKDVDALWCSASVEVKAQSQATYDFHQWGSMWTSYRDSSTGDMTPVGYHELYSHYDDWFHLVNFWNNSTWDDAEDIGDRYRVGIEQYIFEPITGHNLYSPDNLDPIVDIHFIGNFELGISDSLLLDENENPLPQEANIRVFGHYSPYKHNFDQDMEASAAINPDEDPPSAQYVIGDGANNGYGSPEEYVHFGNPSEYDSYDSYEWCLQKMYFYSKDVIATQYSSYLTQGLHGHEEKWISNFGNLVGGIDKGMDAKSLTLYYMTEPFEQPTDDAVPNTAVAISSTWTQNNNNFHVRKVWANNDVFSNNFYVSAKGRLDDDTSYTNINNVKAKIKVLEEEEKSAQSDQEVYKYEYENLHHITLYKILTNKRYREKIINGETYHLMIRFETEDISSYLWDISLSNIFSSEDFGSEGTEGVDAGSIVVSGNDYESRSDKRGWVYDITAKNYGEGLFHQASDLYGFPAFDLVYGKINWVDRKEIESIDIKTSRELADEITSDFQEEYDFGGWSNLISIGWNPISFWQQPANNETIGGWSDFFDLEVFNIKNKVGDGWISPESVLFNDLDFGAGYCRIFWKNEDMEGNPKKLIENGAEIIKNLIKSEMGLENSIDSESELSITDSIDALGGERMAFSINETKESQEIIENICKQSRLNLRYKQSSGSFIIGNIKNQYNTDIFDKEINVRDMLRYKHTKTKIEDLCVGGCSVKWGWDYDKGEHLEITEERTHPENIIEDYKLRYGVVKEDNYKLILEAPYISDELSAIKFRDFMFNYYKNQHTIIKFSISSNKAFELESGDILKINSDKKVYGALLQEGKTLIDQEIYPLFYITSISKSLDKVDIECVQLHNLS